MEEFKSISSQIFVKGEISEDDIKNLSRIFIENKSINKEIADTLFEIKDKINKRKQAIGFADLFVDTITRFLLEDDESPGEIDEYEAKWLRAKMQRNGKIDEFDRKLLKNLQKKSLNFPEILSYKNKAQKGFETMLFSFRFITFLAVIGSLLASMALFVRSSMHIYEGLKLFIVNFHCIFR